MRLNLRAKKIISFFIQVPIPYRKVYKMYESGRQWRLAKRVFDGKNNYTAEDLDAWERVISKLKYERSKIKKA